jgi:nucleotide-binding universal stress UspA family protein
LFGVKLHIVSCYVDSRGGAVWAGAAAQARGAPMTGHDQEGRTRAQHSVERAQQRISHLGVESETHVWVGEPADALVQIAEDHGAQMIVVGNRGMTGARRVLGSVPNRVSHNSPCDVLIVTTG